MNPLQVAADALKATTLGCLQELENYACGLSNLPKCKRFRTRHQIGFSLQPYTRLSVRRWGMFYFVFEVV